MKNFIFATAGHVDHGKSALVKALTGTDPDRLPEEKARGITIDLGFAELNLNGSNKEKIHAGIVDVPGHEDFVRNMIAGVGSIDLALLVVAADDGWMPQTEEHLQILIYLGVKRIVVALTKCDLGKIENVTAQIRKELQDTPFANSQIVPTSTRTGDGIENLKSALASEFANSSTPHDIGKPRLFVDRAFTLRGIGTVVTGTLTGGSLHAGDSVFVQPRNHSARIRSLQTHGRNVDLAQPGMRTAINLPDLEIGPAVKRGDVITDKEFEASSTIDVFLMRSARLQHTAPIKSGTSAYVHHGTTRVAAKIIFAATDSLAVGQNAIAQLRFQASLLSFVGDRLIIRDPSEQHTIAGGVVLNVDCNSFRRSHERELLASRAVAPDDVGLAVWTEISCQRIIQPSQFLERSRFGAAEISACLKRLSEHGEIFLSDKVGAKMVVWRELRARAAELINAHHKRHPERRGLELNDLRIGLKSPSPEVFDALIVYLCQGEFVRAGSTIAKRTHQASLPPELNAAAEKIQAALKAKPFDPPSSKDFLKDERLRPALKFLIEQGEIIEISDDIVLIRDSFDQMRATISDFISAKGPATASQLREKIGTSRRVIIPFLEYLDRVGVTQRSGDLRTLRETKSTSVARP